VTTDLTTVTPDGKLRLHLHRGQWRAWESQRRFVLVLAGTQSGKTSFGPLWLWREIQRCGPGDYLVATPTFSLLELKLLPELRRLFEQQLQLGQYVGSPTKKFVFSPDGSNRTFGPAPKGQARPATTIYFGHAQDPESLESATIKAAWLDEAGQRKFKLGSWEAVLRRLSIHRGRVLLTTTPYALGWLKSELHDRYKAGDKTIDLINFRSIDNPAFSREEYEERREKMPGWKFRMMYDGIFEKPAGLIYDCWEDKINKVPRFAVPEEWQRYLGLDFGGVNTAGVFLAEHPQSKDLYLYREYKAGGRTAKEHVAKLLAEETRVPVTVGGSRSEGQWRAEFRAGGLPVREPMVREVEVGIDRVYGLIKAGRLHVFDDLPGVLDQVGSYSRVLLNDEPTEEIEDKETYHYLDALRYVSTLLAQPQGERRGTTAHEWA
jgi:hypothetical protein